MPGTGARAVGIVVVFDSGYDLTRLAWLLQDLPVEVLGRLRTDRVMYFPGPPRPAGANGRPSRHGAAFRLADEKSSPAPPDTAHPAPPRPKTAPAPPRPGGSRPRAPQAPRPATTQ